MRDWQERYALIWIGGDMKTILAVVFIMISLDLNALAQDEQLMSVEPPKSEQAVVEPNHPRQTKAEALTIYAELQRQIGAAKADLKIKNWRTIDSSIGAARASLSKIEAQMPGILSILPRTFSPKGTRKQIDDINKKFHAQIDKKINKINQALQQLGSPARCDFESTGYNYAQSCNLGPDCTRLYSWMCEHGLDDGGIACCKNRACADSESDCMILLIQMGKN